MELGNFTILAIENELLVFVMHAKKVICVAFLTKAAFLTMLQIFSFFLTLLIINAMLLF